MQIQCDAPPSSSVMKLVSVPHSVAPNTNSASTTSQPPVSFSILIMRNGFMLSTRVVRSSNHAPSDTRDTTTLLGEVDQRA